MIALRALLPAGVLLSLGLFPAPATGTPARSPLIIGDSIAVGATPVLHALGISVDAQVGRQFSFSYRADFGEGDHVVSSGISEAMQLRERGSLPPTVVVELGTNGPITKTDVRSMLWVLRGHRVLFVTTYALSGAPASTWTRRVNAVLWWAHWQFRVPLVLWSRVVRPWLITNADGLGVHPTPAGATVFARLIAHAVRGSA